MTLQTLPAETRWNLFKIEGRLDFVAAPTIQTALAHAAQLDRSHLLIDLEDITRIDDAGISKLVGTVASLMAERPSLNIAFVTKEQGLAEALARAPLPPSVLVFRSGPEALRAIGLHAAA